MDNVQSPANAELSIPTTNQDTSPAPKTPKRNIFLIGVVLLLIILFSSLSYYAGMSQKLKSDQTTPQKSNSVIPTAVMSSQKTNATNITQQPSQVDCSKGFGANHSAKYPMPSESPIPNGLENQLFPIYASDTQTKKIYSGGQPNRTDFQLTQYYGDVAMGRIGGTGSSAQWMMNNVNGQWKVIIAGTQEAPSCDHLKPFINDLKDWQGGCYSSGGKIIDIKHPSEPYNSCNF